MIFRFLAFLVLFFDKEIPQPQVELMLYRYPSTFEVVLSKSSKSESWGICLKIKNSKLNTKLEKRSNEEKEALEIFEIRGTDTPAAQYNKEK